MSNVTKEIAPKWLRVENKLVEQYTSTHTFGHDFDKELTSWQLDDFPSFKEHIMENYRQSSNNQW